MPAPCLTLELKELPLQIFCNGKAYIGHISIDPSTELSAPGPLFCIYYAEDGAGIGEEPILEANGYDLSLVYGEILENYQRIQDHEESSKDIIG